MESTQERPIEPAPEPEAPASNRGPMAALVVVLVLVVLGFVLTQALRKNSNIQDCVASGRTNCAPVGQ
jgi:hypothetical protein